MKNLFYLWTTVNGEPFLVNPAAVSPHSEWWYAFMALGTYGWKSRIIGRTR